MKCRLAFLTLCASLMVLGCGDDAGGVYCRTYESRHSACGGDYTDGATEYYEFHIDDYFDGWSPTDVCNKFSGTRYGLLRDLLHLFRRQEQRSDERRLRG